MSRIVLSSKLLENDIEANFLPELGEYLDGLEFPADKGWHAKIIMRPHPQAKPNVIYKMKFVAKTRILNIAEEAEWTEAEHPVDIEDDMIEAIPAPFITSFLMGLPTAMEYM